MFDDLLDLNLYFPEIMVPFRAEIPMVLSDGDYPFVNCPDLKLRSIRIDDPRKELPFNIVSCIFEKRH